MKIPIRRMSLVLRPDQSRVLLRPFAWGDTQRAGSIITRIMEIPEERVGSLLGEISADFSRRHEDLQGLFRQRFEEVREPFMAADAVSDARRQLIGAYFLAEYSLESAALFNPSIVPDPDQRGLPPGSLRFILSLRATGEGHISSITFRSGVLDANCRIQMASPTGFLTEPSQIPNSTYEKDLFTRTLFELGLNGDFTAGVMSGLGEQFTLDELRDRIDTVVNEARQSNGMFVDDQKSAKGIWMLAKSNYEVQFQPEQALADRIIFPATPSQSNGIEDARFVKFHDGDGPALYYATFTAFDGKVIMPELVETADFLSFRFITLNGPAAQNKGMALFPRKINGSYAMLSRQDNENIYIMFSDNVHFWNDCKELLKPQFPWELVQIGNCGAPIETDAGWLVLSHGVGAMRQYCIGAFLLDRDDPTQVIGRLREPLLKPDETEREGYVPNVVYTCGALIHNGVLVMPYGLADHATGFATAQVDDVLAAMET